MHDVELALRRGHLLTLDSHRRIFPEGTLLIDQGRLVDVGPDQALDGTYHARDVVDLAGAVVHPGLVDAHTHVAWHLTRCWKSEEQDPDRLWSELEYPLITHIGPRDEELGTALACAEMALNGTTTFCDTGSCLHLEAAVAGARRIGLRGIMGYLLADVGLDHPRLKLSSRQCAELLERAIVEFPWDEDHLVGCAACLIGMGTASDELLRQARALADDHGVPVVMHESFCALAPHDAQRRYQGRLPVPRLDELGLLDRPTTLVHMNQVTTAELEILREKRPAVVHCPTAGMIYGLGAARHALFPEMLAAGVPVALGTDSCHWGNNFNLWRSLYLAVALHREARARPSVIADATALEMATRHGARAVGLEHAIGSLEPGKQADLVIHRRDRPELWPLLFPVRNLVFGCGGATIDAVLVQGRYVVRNGRLTNVDLEDLLAEAQEAALALAHRIGLVTPL